MILGEFYEETGEPTIVGFVYFPRFKESGKVPFLLDTGAKGTYIRRTLGNSRYPWANFGIQ